MKKQFNVSVTYKGRQHQVIAVVTDGVLTGIILDRRGKERENILSAITPGERQRIQREAEKLFNDEYWHNFSKPEIV